ncbi:MAG: alpha/beta fold hydrolase [Lachnospiraceae bacterium]
MSKTKKIAALSLLASAASLPMLFTNKYINMFSTRRDLLYSDNEHYYNWRFGRIFYTKQGNGTPILLVHDISHYGAEVEFKKIKKQLSKHHTVYTIDLLGCGRSDKSNITYTSYLYVQLLNDFVKQVIKTPTDIIASGLSCSIAVMACYTEVNLYKKLLLINPTNFQILNKIPNTALKAYKGFIDFPLIGSFAYYMLNTIDKTKATVRKQFYHPSKVSKTYLLTCYEASHTQGINSKYIYSSIHSRYMNTNIAHALRELNNSIYIVMGKAEPNYRETLNQYLTQNCAIEASTLSNTKHYPHLENPTEFLEICNIFF